jgi:hypothetical protein
MKKPLLKPTLLATAGIALISSSSMAQSSTTYAQGDFLLGFRATGGTGAGSNVLVDIGPGSSFLNSPTPVTFTLSNLFSSLNGTFGNNWTTRSDVLWSVAGADAVSTSNPVYVTAPEPVGNGEATPWNKNSFSQSGVRNKINTEGGLPNSSGYNHYTGNVNPFGAGPAVIEGQTDNNSYGSYMPGGTSSNAGPAPGISYNVYNPTIEGTFANGTGGITLDLIKGAASGAGTDIGDFTLNDSGVLTFTPDLFEAIPEASTYATGLLAVCCLAAFATRRWKARAQS